MYKNLNLKLGFIIAITIIACFLTFPLDKRINLGLDLQGGMHLVLRVDTSKLSPEAKKDATERALEVIRNRIDEFGVKEPSIQRQGENEIVVQLPGITERGRAIELIGKTALLEFKLVNSDPEVLRQALSGQVPENLELKALEDEKILVEKAAALTGDTLVNATVNFDQSQFNEPVVALRFNSKGADEFAAITANNVGKRLAIVLDGKVQSAPRINEPIPSGEAVITGRFTPQEASDLAIVLRVGALPAPIYVEEERTIGPLLGQDSIKAGVNAATMGAAFIFVFMVGYYLLSGLISSFALIINLLLTLAGLSFLHSTLTLPGIAGIALTLGMAVDANVLINERIREELGLGKPLATAIANGYHRALSAIVDANVTTLIAAFLLFQFGTGPIRGFAVTLTIGILASLFTAVVMTRSIFELLLKYKMLKKLTMFQFFKHTKFDYIKYRNFFFVVSLIVIITGSVLFAAKKDMAFGVDFSGGQLQEYKFKDVPSVEQVRSALREINLADAVIQQFKSNPNQIIIRTKEDTASKVSDKFKQALNDNPFEVIKIEKVGPIAGKILKEKAVYAITLSLLGILAYVWIRFKRLDFAVAGVVALLHDIIVALVFTVASGRPLDLLIVTGLLTIAGFSINDTIVIFDRIRETSRSVRKMTLAEIINLSVNQTLSRTILTTVCTLFVVLSLFWFGGEVLNGFAFCLLVGFISGTYSTVFIASPIVLMLSKSKK